MKIAVPYENGQVFGHFGHTPQFKVYTISGDNMTTEILNTDGAGHGTLFTFLQAHDIDTVICGGIGGGAQAALAAAGIALYGGVTGSADAAVSALLAGTLSYSPTATCNHHKGEHGSASHACGAHGCSRACKR